MLITDFNNEQIFLPRPNVSSGKNPESKGIFFNLDHFLQQEHDTRAKTSTYFLLFQRYLLFYFHLSIFFFFAVFFFRSAG